MRSLNQPRYYDRGRPIDPEIECGVTYRTPGGLDSQVRALFIRDQKPSAQLSQSFLLAPYASLNWALVLDPVRFGGGMHLQSDHIGFDYTLSHHPILGMTHTVTLTIRMYRRDDPGS
jgi:hypothetical protein